MPIPPFLIQLAKMAATTFASVAASNAASRFTEGFTKADTEPSNEEIQEHWQQFLNELQGEFEETKKQLEETKKQLEETKKQLEETKKQLEETKKQLKKERQKHERHIVVAGVLCLILGGLVSGSVTWYFLQPGQHSEQIISLEELEKYEKARDTGLQALEDYVIQNPNSPYISQAKALILIYRGKE